MLVLQNYFALVKVQKLHAYNFDIFIHLKSKINMRKSSLIEI